MEDVKKLPDYITTDNVLEEGSSAVAEASEQAIETSDDINLMPKQKTRKHVRLRHLENDLGPTFNQTLDGGSIHTTPSMLSLISMPNQFEDDTRTNAVATYLSLYNNNFSAYYIVFG